MAGIIAGADVGGTMLKLALFTEEGTLLRKWSVKTPGREEIDTLFSLIGGEFLKKAEAFKEEYGPLRAAGINLPGPVKADGHLANCVNLGMDGCYPAIELEKILGVPCAAANDANGAALGEAYFGAARGYENVVMLTLGTGIGSGVIVDGKLIAGNRGMGGEIGHLVVRPDETVPCNCGNRGCLEQYASANGCVRVAKKLLLEKTETESRLRDIPDFNCKDVFDVAEEGDPIASETLEIFGDTLGLALAHVFHVIDPDIFVIGGGVSYSGQIVIDLVEKYFRKYCHIIDEMPEFKLAALGNDAGVYGAMTLARERL